VSEIVCVACGHRNGPGSRFCSSCGETLDDGSGPDRTTVSFSPAEAAEVAEAVEGAADVPAGAGMLIVTRGPKRGSRILLDQPVTTAGRHPDSDIFLDDITVSRRHAEIALEGDRFVVRDVGSLNGTYVNRERIEDRDLIDGDELQVGKYKLAFVVGHG
jgi:pSer/pThr/pTyr-binding forkhead associated (FHA) protein